jgi:hypothetical protein
VCEADRSYTHAGLCTSSRPPTLSSISAVHTLLTGQTMLRCTLQTVAKHAINNSGLNHGWGNTWQQERMLPQARSLHDSNTCIRRTSAQQDQPSHQCHRLTSGQTGQHKGYEHAYGSHLDPLTLYEAFSRLSGFMYQTAAASLTSARCNSP